jgi:hypothetical protein
MWSFRTALSVHYSRAQNTDQRGLMRLQRIAQIMQGWEEILFLKAKP